VPGNSPTVRRVLKGELCAGCGLCASIGGEAWTMASTPPGYNRPVGQGPVTREQEKAIAHACPGSAVAAWPREGAVDAYWGPYKRVLSGRATDDLVRFEGSSGGVISGLLIHALESGLVDRVLHVAPDLEDPTRNSIAISRTAAEVIARAGSRYTASSPLAQIDRALAEGGKMAFVGKPCDASALRRLGEVDPRVSQHIPLIISFFCGGIPSHAGVGRILSAMQVEAATVREFRYRGRGWPGNAVAVTDAGRAVEMSYAESWGDYLSKEVQFRCKICPDAVGGVADIACADAWYGDERGYPSFAEQDGRSLIVSRTDAGERLLASAIAAGAVSAEPLDIAEIVKMQPSQARRKRLVFARTLALRLILQPRPRMDGLRVEDAARRAPLKDTVRDVVGTLRRTLLGRRSRL
jgi:coenzyme F420 hydrogenase subunit beta